MAESRTIGVFGAGWVGLVTGGCFAELGHEVIVRDVMPERIEALRAGKLPFHEPDLPEVLERNRERITYTLDNPHPVVGRQGPEYHAAVIPTEQAAGTLAVKQIRSEDVPGLFPEAPKIPGILLAVDCANGAMTSECWPNTTWRASGTGCARTSTVSIRKP